MVRASRRLRRKGSSACGGGSMPSDDIRCIAINTGGGDAPGLNAVIRAVTITALRHGWKCVGNPLEYPTQQPDGTIVAVDRSDDLMAAFRERGIDALVAVGGDGSLEIAN